ncbi:hypothetical protein J6590_013552 [Homalodisca vitripennis]|nr:hypothetical protein J6590_013552 [Homalodisca vitripennis]
MITDVVSPRSARALCEQQSKRAPHPLLSTQSLLDRAAFASWWFCVTFIRIVCTHKFTALISGRTPVAAIDSAKSENLLVLPFWVIRPTRPGAAHRAFQNHPLINRRYRLTLTRRN